MGVDSIDEAPIILNHLLLCNNTLVEIHFGQVTCIYNIRTCMCIHECMYICMCIQLNRSIKGVYT